MVLEAFQRRARHLAASHKPAPLTLAQATLAHHRADDALQLALVAAYGEKRAQVMRYKPVSMHTPADLVRAFNAKALASEEHSAAWERVRALGVAV